MTKLEKQNKIISHNFAWYSREFASMLGLVIALLIIPLFAQGARLYLEPANGQYHQGDTFIAEVKLDTESEEINTAQVNLTFPQNLLEAVDFSKGNSILTLWPEGPSFSNQTGKIYFVGGIPGGYSGKDGLLGKIIFKAKKEGEATVQIKEDSQVLLNDGMGTPAKLNTGGAIFRVLAEKREVPEDEWQKLLEKDKIPPDPFEIKIGKEATVFEGKYFIAFSTIDKQTGLDHFQVKEGKRNWKRVESPYLLEDQSLKSIIKVKAVDKAGNERISEYFPPKKPFPYWIIVLILVGIGVIWVILKRIRKR
jgi:hypothetical protein